MKNSIRHFAALAAGALVLHAQSVKAADWSDTQIGYRYGTKFGEPFEGNNIVKNIIDFQHVSGYKYGVNFFNVDLLISDSADPSGPGAKSGAHETYVVYRHLLDLGKVSGKNLSFSVVRGVGITAGFDYNSKTDAGYNSKKRMLVAGPTLMMDVPGFLNISVLQLWESNAPCNDFTNSCVSRYSYKPHPMLSLAFGIPFHLGPVALSYEGYANYIAAKGTNEFGGPTAPETNWDSELMYDIGELLGAKARTFKLGPEFQLWKNKFGNPADGPAGSGAFAKTWMVRAEYHF
jgi:hypothetical protein